MQPEGDLDSQLLSLSLYTDIHTYMCKYVYIHLKNGAKLNKQIMVCIPVPYTDPFMCERKVRISVSTCPKDKQHNTVTFISRGWCQAKLCVDIV